MIRFLPCKSFNCRTVRMDTEHIGFHSTKNHTIDLIIAFIITLKSTVIFPCTGNCLSFQISQFCLSFFQSFHCNLSTCKIGKFHTKGLPYTGMTYTIGNTVIDEQPVLCHLICIPFFIQFFCRIKSYFFSLFSTHLKRKNTGNILSQIIDFSSIHRMKKDGFIEVYSLHRGLKLFFQNSGRFQFFRYNLCLFP